MVWWLILYYPIIGALIFLGHRAEKRFPPNSNARNRTDLALGCAVLAMPGAPLIFFIGRLIVSNPSDPTIQIIETIGLFWIGLALFFGGLAKFPWMRKTVAAIQNRIRTMLTLN
jgi:hypothetical protein